MLTLTLLTAAFLTWLLSSILLLAHIAHHPIARTFARQCERLCGLLGIDHGVGDGGGVGGVNVHPASGDGVHHPTNDYPATNDWWITDHDVHRRGEHHPDGTTDDSVMDALPATDAPVVVVAPIPMNPTLRAVLTGHPAPASPRPITPPIHRPGATTAPPRPGPRQPTHKQ